MFRVRHLGKVIILKIFFLYTLYGQHFLCNSHSMYVYSIFTSVYSSFYCLWVRHSRAGFKIPSHAQGIHRKQCIYVIQHCCLWLILFYLINISLIVYFALLTLRWLLLWSSYRKGNLSRWLVNACTKQDMVTFHILLSTDQRCCQINQYWNLKDYDSKVRVWLGLGY